MGSCTRSNSDEQHLNAGPCVSKNSQGKKPDTEGLGLFVVPGMTPASLSRHSRALKGLLRSHSSDSSLSAAVTTQVCFMSSPELS